VLQAGQTAHPLSTFSPQAGQAAAGTAGALSGGAVTVEAAAGIPYGWATATWVAA
jgi:hypothetical protein